MTKKTNRNDAILTSEFNAPNQFWTLSDLRKLAGLTQCEMATKLGVTQPAYAVFEKSVNLRAGTLQKIITAIGGELHFKVRLHGHNFNLKVV